MDLVREIETFRQSIPEDKRPTWFRTTTITLTSCHLREQGVTIDPDVIRNIFYKLKTIPIYLNKRSTPFEWRVFYSDFYNQVSIGYTDQLSTKKVKVFPNGSLQVAGCADMDDCSRFVAQLRFLLNMVYKVDIPAESFRVVMYNGYFSLNHQVNVYNFIDTLEAKSIQYSYDPDRYAAVKVKLNRVTVSVFVSGSVLVTGTKSIREAMDTYKLIVSLVIGTHDAFIQKNDMSEKFNIYLGYPVEEWIKLSEHHSK